MEFVIVARTDNGCWKLRVAASNDGAREIYIISAGGKSVTLANDLPFLQQKQLKNWQPTWKQIAGQELSKNAVNAIINAIEAYYNPPPQPRPHYVRKVEEHTHQSGRYRR